jgi:hypothetical protein
MTEEAKEKDIRTRHLKRYIITAYSKLRVDGEPFSGKVNCGE